MGGLRVDASKAFSSQIFHKPSESYYNVQVRIGDYDLTVAGETSLERTLGVASIRQGQ